MRWAVRLSCLMLVPAMSYGQPLAVPNAGFELGDTSPAGWTLQGDGSWQNDTASDPTGSRVIRATGSGEDTSYWMSDPLPLQRNAVYQVRYRARSVSGDGGTPITGPTFGNVDLGDISAAWEAYSSIFVTPYQLTADNARLRFGQWHRDGAVAFDDIELTQVQPIYTQVGDLQMGEGEEIVGNDYVFRAPLHSDSRNHARSLAWHNCRFNTYRLVFGADSELVYRHQLGNRQQLAADIGVNIGWYAGGELEIAVSAGGQDWQVIGRADSAGTATYAVPPQLLPAPEVWVRLRSISDRQLGPDSDPGSFQIHDYTYRARVTGEPLHVRGRTRFAAVQVTDSDTPVRLTSIGEALPGRPDTVRLQMVNQTKEPLTVFGAVIAQGDGVRSLGPMGDPVQLPPGPAQVWLPYLFQGTGDVQLSVVLDGGVKYQSDVTVRIPDLYASHYGEALPSSDESVGLWWADSGWKIARERGMPTAQGEAVRIAAARNEAEAAQLVLRPAAPLQNLRLAVEDLEGPGHSSLPGTAVDVLRVAYVPVTQPTDPTGAAGDWPDPLPPIEGPVNLSPHDNQPFWIRVTVPPGTPAGLYEGDIVLTADDYGARVPLRVEVYDFDLPDRMTCQTAFGFSPSNVYSYHHLTEASDRRAVIDKYLANFAAHHISPYDPAPLDALDVTWPEVPDDLASGAVLRPQIDFSSWDRAMSHALDELHFNSFRLSIPGMGGGTFHSRREPQLQGYSEDTAAYHALFQGYVREMQEHLRDKGWLDEAFVYWFDEPDPKDYDFVMNGFRKLAAAGPDITRMLTEQVEPELVGGPNLWCPVSPNYQAGEAAHRRQQAGDRFWWYVCTVPKAPFATLFIDHPATELRVWLWQTWQRQIDGILVWQTNYWTSDAAYPDGLQNPYEDPMGWVSGYSTAIGNRLAWGNGDGRFVYPPEAAAGGAAKPVLDGPVDSIRWEMLRDGIEDYEYLAMLSRLLRQHGERLEPQQRAAMQKLLEVPDQITASVTQFTRDPSPIKARRDALARALVEITALQH